MFFLIISFEKLVIASSLNLPKKLFTFIYSSFLDEKMGRNILRDMVYAV